MSCIRDVRLLIARHLDLPTNIRAAVLNVLNITDAALDAEGWQEGDDIKAALRMLDAAVLDVEDVEVETEEAEDDDDLVDIDDIEILEEDDEDDEIE